MKRNKNKILLIIVLLIVVAGILFFQRRVYRSVESSLIMPSPLIEQVVSAGVAKDGIPVINEPVFESVSVADQYLDNDGKGIAVSLNGAWRFYPYQILVWHEVVNDVFQTKPILVTYCPLCSSGLVYERIIGSEPILFGTSEFVLDNSHLLYETKSGALYSPMRNSFLDQHLKPLQPFQHLKPILSYVMTWTEFKLNHKEGKVLSRKTGATRDYTHNPYGDYETTHAILFPLSVKDDRMASKEKIVGLEIGGEMKAYRVQEIKQHKQINDTLHQTAILIKWDDKWNLPRAFTINSDGSLMNEEPLTNAFWFAWVAAHPNTYVYSSP